ncbi:MAG: UDP-N-acetylglucosamine 2-epimerase (non-hydrolyzing) [Thermoflexales bacterium]|nr:UDP-N-acetylglucosamine 2-epimerase (non-hydrolyzing) [Thermoflexales bacterium]MCX7938135.1 UDP-N-acetylglucosamine 2-epimerase (non-hydrolyzing) [Thermoflexales bacterium]MDW8054037.1 UDP-N-acetylglucosamine 2-epimerase (non-hydrolyzing) [Anaerolineae bacterium]MDW8292628.1 UDP-N-acetylglucosamine 2-epimerase (non-hydrolyzing) [Anaerolineae bacterium]
MPPRGIPTLQLRHAVVTVLVVFGTRPEAIKLAPVIRALHQRSAEFRVRVCVTGQHRQMLDSVLHLFAITPDYDLNLMQPNQSLCHTASSVLQHLEPVLRQVRPDWVIIQGDTTSVAAAALAAFYCEARVAHVEAGLRTYDKHQPFPEEINRRVASVIADLHFAPTERARQNLLREGIPAHTIHVTGNTIVDALHWIVQHSPPASPLLDGVLADEKPLVLITAHRRENFGRGLEDICLAVRELAQQFPQVRFVYPVHLNPNVRAPAYRLLRDIPNVTLTDPLDYATMAHLLRRATLVLTDSGGIQEEAPTFGKPVLVLREITERPEVVEAGVARLVGTDRARIVAETTRLLTDPEAYARMAHAVNPYGDGRAAERIADILARL